MNLNLSKQINVLDVTLRDGFQNEEKFIPTEAKLYVVNKLIDAGVKRIEVGSLSHIKYVPQFKDIEAVLEGLPDNKDVEYSVLALNSKAVERVVDLLNRGIRIDRVLTGQIATSEAYARKNMNRTHEQLFESAEKNVKTLHEAGIKKVVANIGTIFGCPVQGDVPIERAYEFADRMISIGFDEIEHSDPDGKATPLAIMEYFDAVLSKYPGEGLHTAHIHDIRGAGLASYFAAMQVGITEFECSLGGIGGQVANIVDGIPVKGSGEYYFQSRRTGLVCTEDFVTMVNEMKLETGIDTKKIYKVGRDLERILGRELGSFTSTLKAMCDI